MDSGHSTGSMQSSSGGDEEYDSRSESVSAFLSSSSNFGSLSNPHHHSLNLSHHHQNQNQQQPSTFFDHSSNYLHALSQSPLNTNPSSLLNLDLVGSRNLRSDSSPLNHNSFPSSSIMQQQPRLLDDNGAPSLAPCDHRTNNVVKNPKKRTRTSRRAPTTVLTTDTSNFRAMVQEFTGIPAPPFSGSPYTRRMDLFGSGSAVKTGNLEPMGPLYALRPTTQKYQPNPFVSSSSVIDAVAASTSTVATSNNDNTIATSISATNHSTLTFHSPSDNNYQLLSNLGLHKEPQSMLNPALSFQSLLQSPLNPPLNVHGFGSKSQGSFGHLPLMEDHHLAVSHGHVNSSIGGGVPNHVDSGHQDHHLIRSLDGNYGNSSQRVASCKLNFSASSSDFPHDKSFENVSSRGEGTVDSWICPSD